MIVCACERVTLRELEAARDRGATTLDALARATGAGMCCDECRPIVREVLATSRAGPQLVVRER